MPKTIVRLGLMATLIAAVGCASAPPYQGMTPEAMYTLAQERFAEEEWDAAADVLDRLMLTAQPGFQYEPEARLLLAQSYYNDEKFLTAQDEFTRFLGRFPTHELVPEASLGICESFAALSPISQRDQQFTTQAELVCLNVASDYSGRDEGISTRSAELAAMARGRLAQKEFDNAAYYSKRGRWDSAIIYYQVVFEEFADTDWAPRALVGIIEAYTAIGYDDEVDAWKQTLVNAYPDSPEARLIGAGGSGDRSPSL